MEVELPLNDNRLIPKKGTPAWLRYEWKRYRQLCADHGGLTTPKFAGVALGVSRQRVYQLMQAGRIRSFEVFEHTYLSCHDVEDFATLDRNSGTRYGARVASQIAA